MTRARSTLISLSDTPWYHLVSRCVRRAYLCGTDAYSGRCFEHRRGWIVERIKQLAGVFAIDVAAYAVMSNHYHLVIRVDAERARGWSREEVLRRWTQIFDGPPAVQRWLAGDDEGQNLDAHRVIEERTEEYRRRLYDLSWFARVLNETIARKANAEDEVTGRFWDGRFKSQALLDEQAILTAMVYVDLNPIRARMADTPEASQYTSVAERIAALRPQREEASSPEASLPQAEPYRPLYLLERETTLPPLRLRAERNLARLPLQPLMPFDATRSLKTAIPFAFPDYLALVEATGRRVRADKRGSISSRTPPLLVRLNIDPERFIDCATQLMKQFANAIGTPAELMRLCAARQVKYLRGITAARAAFESRVA